MRDQKRQGMVLLVVLIVVMLLSLAAYEYVFLTQTEHMAAALGGERMVTRQAALSARDLLAVFLEMPRAQRNELGGLEDNPDYFSGNASLLTMTAEMTPRGDLLGDTSPASLGLIAYPLAEEASSGGGHSPGIATGFAADEERDGPAGRASKATRYGAINESSKLHLIKVLEFEAEQSGNGVAALLQLPGMDQTTAESLLDWMDRDDQPRPEGAESEFYARLSPPLAPRQGLPLDLEELLLVRGVTQARLFDAARPPVALDALSSVAPVAVEETFADPPWSELITVYSSERNETYRGRPRIFVNQDDLRELHRELTQVLPQEWANFLVLYRQHGPAESDTKELAVEIPAADLAVSANYLLESPLDLVNAVVRYEDDAGKSLAVASPFGDDPASLQSQLPVLLDAITLMPEPRVVGRININLAPPQVLACLPLPADTVQLILRARETSPVDPLSRIHPVWLLAEGLVDLPTMRELLPHVTCGGDVYRADIWGYVDDRTPLFHLETILDASSGYAQSVFYRELAAPRNVIQIPATEPDHQLDPRLPSRREQPPNPQVQRR